MKLIEIILFIIFCQMILLSVSCKQRSSNKNIVIKGKLKNLPDGTMVMKSVYPNYIIDSTITKNGSFSFSISSETYPEPIEIQLIHFDQKKSKRFFIFKTNILFGGKILYVGDLMLEDRIEMSDSLIESTPNNFNALKKWI